jgi:glycosyltransferase involved in cell wall biosynthesis
VLSISYRVPYPRRDGGNVRGYGYLRELASRHEVTYLCRADEPRPEAVEHLGAFCRRVEIVVDPFRLDFTDRINAVAGGYPFGLITPPDAFFRRCRAVLGRERFDLVYLVGVDTAQLAIDALELAPVVWDVCDCTSRYYDRQAGAERRLWRRLWYRRQASRYRRIERRLLGRDLAVLAGSASEAEAFRDVVGEGRSRLHVMPTGIDSVPVAPEPANPPRLAFTGTLGYPPNGDAVRYFCREILPAVRRVRPDVRLQILGDGASPELLSMCRAEDGVDFLGFVSDIFGTLRHATIFVCPMRQGTGIKVKLLEAMACGLPIVASPLAVEGVSEAEDGQNLLVAASPDAFVAGLLTLLDDADLRRRLGTRAREAIAPYAWDRLGERVDQICREEVARRA